MWVRVVVWDCALNRCGRQAPNTPPAEMLSKIDRFCRDFQKSLTLLHRRRAAKERRARSGTSSSPARGRSGIAAGAAGGPGTAHHDAGALASPPGKRRAKSSLQSLHTPPGARTGAGALPPLGLANLSPSPSRRGGSRSKAHPPVPHGTAPHARKHGGVSQGDGRDGRGGKRASGEAYALQEKMHVILRQWGYDDLAIAKIVRLIVRPPLANVRRLMQDPDVLRSAVEAASARS